MAEAVVHVLEVVEVDEDERRSAARARQRLLQDLEEEAPGVQARQAVQLGLAHEGCLGVLAVGDVLGHPQHGTDRAALVAQRDGRDGQADLPAVLSPADGLQARERLARHDPRPEPLELLVRLGVDEGQAPPDRLCGRPAEQLLGGRVPQLDDAGGVDDVDGQRRARDDGAQQLLVGPCRRGGTELPGRRHFRAVPGAIPSATPPDHQLPPRALGTSVMSMGPVISELLVGAARAALLPRAGRSLQVSIGRWVPRIEPRWSNTAGIPACLCRLSVAGQGSGDARSRAARGSRDSAARPRGRGHAGGPAGRRERAGPRPERAARRGSGGRRG